MKTFSFEYNGESFQNADLDYLRARGVPPSEILAAVKAQMAVAVDEAAERCRATFATPGAGQAMEYQEVQAQARDALDAPEAATSAAFPMLAASIGLDIDPKTGAPAADVVGVARSVIAAYRQWLALGAAIRRVRLEGKAAIAAAATVEAAVEAFGAVSWPAI